MSLGDCFISQEQMANAGFPLATGLLDSMVHVKYYRSTVVLQMEGGLVNK